MAIKTILVPLDGTEAGESVLETAILIARRFESHLEVLHVKADPRDVFPFASEPGTPGAMELMIEAAERSGGERSARARALFDECCRNAHIAIGTAAPASGGVSAAWHEETGLTAEVVAQRGRLVDLICVARPVEKGSVPILLESALMDTGRPVLVAPPKAVKTIGGNVAVAWNGSAEAARAVASALPFLVRAEKVTVVTVKGKDEAVAAPRELSAHLAWHNIRASTKTVTAGAKDAGAALLAEAQALGADLLVMGGYGHSRLREVIFGGVTQHVLSAARMPVLMVH